MRSKKEVGASENSSPSYSQQTNALLQLRELLLSGKFPPGERMRELQISKLLGVSRTPLRLALMTLQHEGLLDMHRSRGFIVRAFGRADVLHAIELRGLLEGMAGRLLVQRLCLEPTKVKGELKPMRDLLQEMDTAVAAVETKPAMAFRDYIELNRRFHAVLMEASASKLLQSEVNRVMCLPFAAPSSGFVHVQANISQSREILRVGQNQHHAIVEAIDELDGMRVENLLREHARLAQRNLDIALARSAGNFSLPSLRHEAKTAKGRREP